MDDLTKALKAAGDDTLREQAAAFVPPIAHGQRPDEQPFEAAHAATDFRPAAKTNWQRREAIERIPTEQGWAATCDCQIRVDEKSGWVFEWSATGQKWELIGPTWPGIVPLEPDSDELEQFGHGVTARLRFERRGK